MLAEQFVLAIHLANRDDRSFYLPSSTEQVTVDGSGVESVEFHGGAHRCLTRAGKLQVEQGEQLLFKYGHPTQAREDAMRVSFGE